MCESRKAVIYYLCQRRLDHWKGETQMTESQRTNWQTKWARKKKTNSYLTLRPTYCGYGSMRCQFYKETRFPFSQLEFSALVHRGQQILNIPSFHILHWWKTQVPHLFFFYTNASLFCKTFRNFQCLQKPEQQLDFVVRHHVLNTCCKNPDTFSPVHFKTIKLSHTVNYCSEENYMGQDELHESRLVQPLLSVLAELRQPSTNQ